MADLAAYSKILSALTEAARHGGTAKVLINFGMPSRHGERHVSVNLSKDF